MPGMRVLKMLGVKFEPCVRFNGVTFPLGSIVSITHYEGQKDTGRIHSIEITKGYLQLDKSVTMNSHFEKIYVGNIQQIKLL